jgi:hypothetical protein
MQCVPFDGQSSGAVDKFAIMAPHRDVSKSTFEHYLSGRFYRLSAFLANPIISQPFWPCLFAFSLSRRFYQLSASLAASISFHPFQLPTFPGVSKSKFRLPCFSEFPFSGSSTGPLFRPGQKSLTPSTDLFLPQERMPITGAFLPRSQPGSVLHPPLLGTKLQLKGPGCPFERTCNPLLLHPLICPG